MNDRNSEGLPKIMLLTLMTLLWLFCIHSFFLPLLQQWSNEIHFRNSEANRVEYSPAEIRQLHDEIESLKEKIEHLKDLGSEEVSAEQLHLFLTEMIEKGGGVLAEMIIECKDAQEVPNFNLSFVWQGDYPELRNCLRYFQTLPWKLEDESIVIRKIVTAKSAHLQLDYRCKLLAQVNANFQKKESTIFNEETKDPFKTK